MFSVPHLIIIFVVVLIVFGPEKLPDLARNLGKIMGEFRRATGDLRSTFDEHMREGENAEAETTGATQADAPMTRTDSSDGKNAETSANASAANAVTNGRVDTEQGGTGESAKAGHSKGSDGGSHPA
jgi:sec-independent protein translocase protein TatB